MVINFVSGSLYMRNLTTPAPHLYSAELLLSLNVMAFVHQLLWRRRNMRRSNSFWIKGDLLSVSVPRWKRYLRDQTCLQSYFAKFSHSLLDFQRKKGKTVKIVTAAKVRINVFQKNRTLRFRSHRGLWFVFDSISGCLNMQVTFSLNNSSMNIWHTSYTNIYCCLKS